MLFWSFFPTPQLLWKSFPTFQVASGRNFRCIPCLWSNRRMGKFCGFESKSTVKRAKSSCWRQPIWKIIVKLDHLPQNQDEIYNKMSWTPISSGDVYFFNLGVCRELVDVFPTTKGGKRTTNRPTMSHTWWLKSTTWDGQWHLNIGINMDRYMYRPKQWNK